MAERYPANVKLSGTISGTVVSLGDAESGYVTLSDQQTAGNIADGDTFDVTLEKDTSNIAIYYDVPWTLSTNSLDYSAGSQDTGASIGTVGDGDTVTVTVSIGQDALETMGNSVSPPASDGKYYAYKDGSWVDITGKIINP
jgi:hypothetical protein